jgi:hypothetical protein
MIEYTKEIKLCAPNNGYECFMNKDHPLAHKTGRVYYHRHLASLKIGRWLTREEQVHHIDENKTNNSIDNLLVCSIEEHNEIHKGKLVEIICPVCDKLFKPNKDSRVCCSISCSSQLNIKRPDLTKEILNDLIPKHSWVVLGAMFGYSDSGIKKRAKALGCLIPIRKRV